MKKWSIKRKLVFLSASLTMMVLVVAAAGFFGTLTLIQSLDKIAMVELPAVRSAGVADMMHDGLRSVAYRAIYLSDTTDLEARKETAQEFKEMSEIIGKELDAIQALKVSEEVKQALAQARPAVDAYVKIAEEIVGLGLSGQRQAAVAKLPEFQKGFDELEEGLEKFSERLENEAKHDVEVASLTANRAKWVSSFLVLIGLVLGFLVSAAIIRALMRDLNDIIGRLTISSRTLTDSASDSASAASELSEASTQQAASLQQTMASVEEISAMVTQNAESAGKVKTTVETNQRASEDGSRSVGDMLSAIGEIKETNDKILNQMESSNTEFGEIVKIISEIGEKTKVINDIVFQTKLLSFNASVEAARAGEHGKGFAVVAEEVGNLAQMSGNAAKQITEMLSESIKKVNGIVEQTTNRVDQLVEVSKDKISVGQSTAHKCKEALDKIAENARTVTSMVAEITHASKEQAQGIQEINKAISQLDQVTQQNSAVAQQSSALGENLSSEAQSLAKAVTTLVELAGVAPADHTSDNVTEITSHRKMKPGKVASKITQASKAAAPMPLKKAAGGHDVPNGADPGFEEF